VLAVELGLVIGPDLLHGQDALPEYSEAPGRVGPVVLHLLPVPAPADTEEEAAAGEEVEGGDLLGRRDGVAFDDEADSRPEEEPLGDHGGGGEGQEGVERLPVLLGQVGPAGPGAAPAGGDMGDARPLP